MTLKGEAKRLYQREWMRNRRLHPAFRAKERERNKVRGRHKANGTCEVCGYNKTTDIHHEGKELHTLCPNCHALITRGVTSLKELQGSTKAVKSLKMGFEPKPLAIPELDIDGNPMPEY